MGIEHLPLDDDTVARIYAKERRQAPPEKNWVNVVCVVVAVLLILGGIINASIDTYHSLMGTGLPPHLNANRLK